MPPQTSQVPWAQGSLSISPTRLGASVGGAQEVCGNHTLVTVLLTSWSPQAQGRERAKMLRGGGDGDMVNLVTHPFLRTLGFLPLNP